MDAGLIITRVRSTLGGQHERALKFMDDSYLFHMLDQAVLELRKELKRPIKERDLPMTVGVRGLNLPDDFMQFADDASVRLTRATDDSAFEGVPFPIINYHQLAG